MAFLSPEPVTMYLLFPEMSQLSTEEDSLDCGQEGAGEERVRRGQGQHGLARAPDHLHTQREDTRHLGQCLSPGVSYGQGLSGDRTWGPNTGSLAVRTEGG